ncbi:type IV secretory system conjugative DNA transfer family protein [Thiomicrospira sp.]|uniref:type IV secretory system conjugative DNA transfer family protein n=1 Tax=Thiomicrospira sp. TaxID=935 RepID=UPI002F948AB1
MRLKKIKPLAGFQDALGLSAIGGGLAASLPYFLGSSEAFVAGAISASAGASLIAYNRAKDQLDRVDATLDEDFILPSAKPYKGEGLIAGFAKDTGNEVPVPYDLLNRHIALIGASGVGKTTLGKYFIFQQMVKGGGYIFIDAKLDADTRDELGYLARAIGRADDFYVLNLDDPSSSNTYNPLLEGDADEVASRIMNLAPSAENNPGADHYRQTANQALTVFVGALKKANILYDFTDLTILLQSPKAIDELMRKIPPSKERMALEVFLDKYRVKVKVGEEYHWQVDVTKLKDALGGMAGRLAQFAQGKFGEIFCTYKPEINLTDIVLNNKMLYIMLPTMSKDVAALNAAKMIMSDLRTAVYRAQSLPEAQRPNPKYLIFADEMGSYAVPGIARLFEQARSANVILMPGFQALGNLAETSPEFADIIMQNNWNKAYFRFGSVKSAKEISEALGTTKTYIETLSQGESNSESKVTLRVDPQLNAADGDSQGSSWREQETEKVSIDKLSALGIGECILTIGHRLYHIRIPNLTTPIKHAEGEEREKLIFKPYRRRVNIKNGMACLDFASKYQRLISAATEQQK